jgi:hypothetical protein
MKPIIKYFIAGTLALFIGGEMNAQDKKKKKQDSTYLKDKQRADEQRNREAEDKRRNDSLRRERYRDSMDQIRVNDSIKYSRPVPPDSTNQADPAKRRQDSLDRSQPQQNKDKKMPPKEGNLQGTRQD